MKHACPMEDCGDQHDMILLAPISEQIKEQVAVVECPAHGFLWCTL
jgi:hypothetical protein